MVWVRLLDIDEETATFEYVAEVGHGEDAPDENRGRLVVRLSDGWLLEYEPPAAGTRGPESWYWGHAWQLIRKHLEQGGPEQVLQKLVNGDVAIWY